MSQTLQRRRGKGSPPPLDAHADRRPVCCEACGVASGVPAGEAGAQPLYAAADQAMYHAKRAGRDRTRVHGEPVTEALVSA